MAGLLDGLLGQPTDTAPFPDRGIFSSHRQRQAMQLKQMSSQELLGYLESLQSGKTWAAGGPKVDQETMQMILAEIESRRPLVQGMGLLSTK